MIANARRWKMNFSGPIPIQFRLRLCQHRADWWIAGSGVRLPHRATFSPSQATSPEEQLHGVLSRARLSPPLRGPARQIVLVQMEDFF